MEHVLRVRCSEARGTQKDEDKTSASGSSYSKDCKCVILRTHTKELFPPQDILVKKNVFLHCRKDGSVSCWQCGATGGFGREEGAVVSCGAEMNGSGAKSGGQRGLQSAWVSICRPPASRVALPEPASCAGWVPALTQRGTPLPSVTCGDPGRDGWAGTLCLPTGFPSAAP